VIGDFNKNEFTPANTATMSRGNFTGFQQGLEYRIFVQYFNASGSSLYGLGGAQCRIVKLCLSNDSGIPADGAFFFSPPPFMFCPGLSDASWLNRRRPGSLYSIVEYQTPPPPGPSSSSSSVVQFRAQGRLP
jgi:hypothetical protein